MKNSNLFSSFSSTLIMIAYAALLVGCASTENAAHTQAEKAYREASADSALMANETAAGYMASASTALDKARHNQDLITFFGESLDPDEVTAQAFVAEQYVAAAQVVASQDAVDAEIAQLKSERDAALLAKQDQDAAALTAQRDQERASQELTAALERAKARGAEVDQTGDQIKVTFRKLTFDTNRTEIKPEFEEVLDDLASALTQRYPRAKLEIQGYSDSTGPAEYNAQLSQQRAVAVRTFLVSKGLSADRVDTYGMGEGSPVASNDTAEGRALNRRVELLVTGMQPE